MLEEGSGREEEGSGSPELQATLNRIALCKKSSDILDFT